MHTKYGSNHSNCPPRPVVWLTVLTFLAICPSLSYTFLSCESVWRSFSKHIRFLKICNCISFPFSSLPFSFFLASPYQLSPLITYKNQFKFPLSMESFIITCYSVLTVLSTALLASSLLISSSSAFHGSSFSLSYNNNPCSLHVYGKSTSCEPWAILKISKAWESAVVMRQDTIFPLFCSF